MVKVIETEIEISSSAERIWQVLTDFPEMGNWNPLMKSIAGELMPGARLRITMQPPGHKPMSFASTLIVVEANRELRWKGKLLVPGVFGGEHYFRLEPIDDERTRLLHGETFSGILIPLLRGMLKDTEKGFHAMNAALKDRSEATP